MWVELIIIAALILLNGFFACAELAIINSRRSRIKQLVEEKNAQARLVQGFQEDSERFLATIQIGVTVAGAAAAAISGATAIETLKPVFLSLPFPYMETLAEPLAVGIVVLVVSYFSLIFGELVPKILALKNPERIALFVVRPLEWFSGVASWGIQPLALSSRTILRLFGKAAQGEKVFISAKEINILMQEGREKGVFNKTEQELIHSVFEFTELSVKEVMVPRPKMCAIEIDTPTPDLLKYIDENKFSRYPVYRKGLNDLLGILYQKDLLSHVAAGKPLTLKELLHPVYYVPEAMKVSVLLKEMQRRRIHMAIVVNEYGSVEGLVTLEDLIEEIVGEIQDEYDTEEKPVERLRDGAILVDASMPVKDLVSEYGLPIPRGGEVFYHGDYKFTVVDLGDRRVSKVKVERIGDRSAAGKEPLKTAPK
jgi:putative hemolysin